MKYLIISGIAILGLAILFFRNNNVTTMIPNIENNLVDTSSIRFQSDWGAYWYSGQAELSGYDLTQSRYGELHEGEAALIFVTEPFSRSKHVKIDEPENVGRNKVSVMKLNASRKFLTGIYPYSMMTSTFNPVNTKTYKSALKLGLSGQEWCGHVFQQLNLRAGNYKVRSFSYFESEGDETFSLANSYLEDEIMNVIRMNPDLLPEGSIEIIPSLMVTRFLHEELKPYEAVVRKDTSNWNGQDVVKFNIYYPHNERNVNIYYHSEFPHIIEGWDDSYKGMNGKLLTTTAKRKTTLQLDYWNKHNNEHRILYDSLYQ